VEKQLVFEHAVEGLVRTLSGKLTPRLEERLKGYGLDLTTKRMPAYTYVQWKAFVATAREELYGGLTEVEGYRRLGQLFVGAYFETIMGRAVSGIVRLLGPRRALERATQNFRSGNNFTETRLTQLEPAHFEFWINAVEHPAFIQGVLLQGLTVAGAKDAKVEVQEFDGTACTFRVSWALSSR
jgi:uncharacterized protein (TIGR02265 family)